MPRSAAAANRPQKGLDAKTARKKATSSTAEQAEAAKTKALKKVPKK